MLIRPEPAAVRRLRALPNHHKLHEHSSQTHTALATGPSQVFGYIEILSAQRVSIPTSLCHFCGFHASPRSASGPKLCQICCVSDSTACADWLKPWDTCQKGQVSGWSVLRLPLQGRRRGRLSLLGCIGSYPIVPLPSRYLNLTDRPGANCTCSVKLYGLSSSQSLLLSPIPPTVTPEGSI